MRPFSIFFTWVLVLLIFGCGEHLGRIGTYKFGDDVTQDRPVEPDPSSEPLVDERDGGPSDEEEGSEYVGADDLDIALEELEMEEEDSDALAAVIRERLSAAEVEASFGTDGVGVPPAHLNLKLSRRECLSRLEEYGVDFEKPDLDTPTVEIPLLLKGPIGGVAIEPRWPQSNRRNAVMDCHLALALVEVANQARAQGIDKILFYSTYRPLKSPPKKCKKGRAGKKCRRLKKKYKKSLKNPSRHRRALAIDIRFLVMEDGETIDVLEHFDRKSREPPCDYLASTKEGRILSDFACQLYKKRIFNVMLTPNANKAHHNHFHFDLTPNAKWYIIR